MNAQYMRGQLSKMSPTLKHFRLTTCPHLSVPDDDDRATWDEFRNQAFQHAVHQVKTAVHRNPFQPNPSPPPPDTPKGKVKRWTVPRVILFLKNKSLTTTQRLQLELAKLREIFTHSSHPLRLLMRKGGICLTVLHEVYAHTGLTLEILDQAHLL